MMKVNTEKKCLVRGYVIYATNRAGVIGLEQAKDENNLDVNVAYTMWHRTDEADSVKQAEQELDSLSRLYSKFQNYGGAMLGFEYRDFAR